MPRHRLAVLVVVLVVLAGCVGGVGGGGDGGDPAAGTVTPEGTAPPASATAAPGPDATPTATSGNGTLAVHFINVGQSTATLVVAPSGETMLVDSGDFTDDGEHVLAYLDRHGIDRIDHLVTTHGDADHIGGHAAVIDHYETEGEGVGAVYDPGIPASTATYGEYLDAVEAHDVPLFLTLAGDRIPVDGVTVRVLGPPEGYLAGEDRNENSIVLLVRFGETAVLLTGDAEQEGEAYLTETYPDLRATVLKAGHHGSSSSTGAALLDAVRPTVVVVSSAYDSRYGHPHEEVLDRLAARSVPTYWTATHGDVVVTSDGRTVRVATQAPAPTAASQLRQGDSVEPGTTGEVRTRATLAAGEAGTGGGTDPTDGAGELVVERVHADADGRDGDNLNDEYVVFRNAGEEPLDLSGWTVVDAAGKRYSFPAGTTLEPGATLVLHSGAGTDSATDLYWDAPGPVWNNDGDTVVVVTDGGQEVLRETYS